MTSYLNHLVELYQETPELKTSEITSDIRFLHENIAHFKDRIHDYLK